MFISIVMYPAICWCEDQAFDDMSEESGEKKYIFEHFIVKKALRSVPSQGIVEQAKNKMTN